MALRFEFILLFFPALFQDIDQTLFKNHGGLFMIMAFVTSSVAVLASAVLICTSYFMQTWMRDVYYTILKSIGFLSAMLAPFSLFIALFIQPNLNWIGYLVISEILFGILVAYFFLWKHVCLQKQQQEEDDKNKLSFSSRIPCTSSSTCHACGGIIHPRQLPPHPVFSHMSNLIGHGWILHHQAR